MLDISKILEAEGSHANRPFLKCRASNKRSKLIIPTGQASAAPGSGYQSCQEEPLLRTFDNTDRSFAVLNTAQGFGPFMYLDAVKIIQDSEQKMHSNIQENISQFTPIGESSHTPAAADSQFNFYSSERKLGH